MSKKYKNPPIVEALCEFFFTPSQPWDMTIPGLFYEKIKNDFPEKQQQISFGVGFSPSEGKIEQKFEMIQRIQFFRTDKTALVQVAPDLLVINHLKPYPTWNIYKPIIFNNLEIYKNIAKPKGFNRIGLRYINKMDFEIIPVKLEDYFNYYPFVPPDLPQEHETFNVNIEIPDEDKRDRLLLTLRSIIPDKPNIISLILELYYILARPEGISMEEISALVENAHTNIEKVFEACITDKCRELFEEVK